MCNSSVLLVVVSKSLKYIQLISKDLLRCHAWQLTCNRLARYRSMPPSTATATAAAPKDDADDLSKKQKELQSVKSVLEDAAKRAAALGSEIKSLEARIAEVKATADLYTTTAQAQQKELDDTQKLVTKKWAMAAAGAKDQKEAIEKVVKTTDDEIASQIAKAATVQKTLASAATDVENANASLKQKQDSYASLKQIQKSTDDQLKRVKSLTDQAAKSEAAGDIAVMYFLLQDASEVAKGINIVPPEEFIKRLTAAQADIETAKTVAAAKKAEFDAQSKQLADAQAATAAATSGRQTTILARLKNLTSPIETPTPAAPPVRQSTQAPSPATAAPTPDAG